MLQSQNTKHYGARGNKIGFKYESCGDARLIARIQKLYPLVYQKKKNTKNSIFVSFAHDLLAKRKNSR